MSVITTEGIILRKYLLRETSYILVVFTKDYGKIRGVLKGVRKPFPQFAGDYEILTRSSITFYRKRNKSLDLITGCETVDSFLGVRNDIERLTYANYIIELVDIVAHDYNKNDDLYNLIISGLALLSNSADPLCAVRVFEFKLLNVLGLGLELDNCVKCSLPSGRSCHLDIPGGGILCTKCSDNTPFHCRVSLGAVNFLRKIKDMPVSRTAQIKVAHSVGKEVERLLAGFLKYHISDNIRSLAFIKELESHGVLA